MWFSVGKIMTCFSITSNFYRLRKIKETEDTKSLKVIQGIRFLNMVLVIACHYVMVSIAGPISNTKFVETVSEENKKSFEHHYTFSLFSSQTISRIFSSLQGDMPYKHFFWFRLGYYPTRYFWCLKRKRNLIW